MLNETGQLSTISDKVEMLWTIPNFFSFTNPSDEYLVSPTFIFLGASWYFKIYPNGETREHDTAGHVGLYITKVCGPRLNVKCCLKFLNIVKENSLAFSCTKHFDERGEWGHEMVISKSALHHRGLEFCPGAVLSVSCSLELYRPKNSKSKCTLRSCINFLTA